MWNGLFILGLTLMPGVFGWDIGVATSAFQIEGGRDARNDTIWDRFCDDGFIDDFTNADIACDSYSQFDEDIYWLKNLGSNDYRFSFSWARLYMNGNVSTPNPAGINFYHRLLDKMDDYNIRAHATIFHWDLPLSLQTRYNGMMDREKFRHDYAAYVDALLHEFGARIETWYTFNEPYTVASLGFGKGIHAPGIKEPVHAPYEVGHTMLLAHMDAWVIFKRARDEKRLRPGAVMTMALNSDFYYPATVADNNATERALQFRLGWFLSPLITGDYPEVMKKIVGDRLPRFSAKESETIRGSIDLIGINYYTSMNVQDKTAASRTPNFFSDPMIQYRKIPRSIPSFSSWLFLYPQGLQGLLSWIVQTYPSGLVFHITENGVSTPPGEWNDELRVQCMNRTFGVVDYIHRAHIANVSKFFIWSLLDNFEWNKGYLETFGLISVDFSKPTRTRTPKLSFYWLQNYII